MMIGKAACLLVLSALPAFAVDIDLVRPDQRYDLEPAAGGEAAEVLVLARKDGKVAVEYLSGDLKGRVEWGAPGRLLTLGESRPPGAAPGDADTRDGGERGAGTAPDPESLSDDSAAADDSDDVSELRAFLDGHPACEYLKCGEGMDLSSILSRVTGSAPSPPPPPTPAPEKSAVPEKMPDGIDRDFLISNGCPVPITIFVVFYHAIRLVNENVGWRIPPDARARLMIGERALRVDGPVVYYYAYDDEMETVWQGDGQYILRVAGEPADMRMGLMRDTGREYELQLDCN